MILNYNLRNKYIHDEYQTQAPGEVIYKMSQ